MKYLALVVIALLGIALTTCIDGVWSPSQLRQPVSQVIERTIAPGKALLSGFENGLRDALSTSRQTSLKSAGLRSAHPHSVARQSAPESDGPALCG